jgi:hypothetical protein
LTAGFGFTFQDLRVDYAMALSQTVKDNSGTHRMSIGYAFGPERERLDSGWRTTRVGSYGGPRKEKSGTSSRTENKSGVRKVTAGGKP